MKGDLSRQTFDPERHYSSVRMQQGKVQLDADWNEQADIGRRRTEVEAADVIGLCGGPVHDAAFGIALDLTGLPAAEKARLDALFPPAFKLAAGDFVQAGVSQSSGAPLNVLGVSTTNLTMSWIGNG